MSHKCEVLFPTMLDLQGALGGKRPHGQPDCPVQNAVQNVERRALKNDTVLVREIVDAVAQDVVLGDDFFNIERVLDPLDAVCRRTAFQQRFRDRFVRPGFECGRQFPKKAGDVIVERGRVKVSRRREQADLPPPPHE